jgi:hypothetical protein
MKSVMPFTAFLPLQGEAAAWAGAPENSYVNPASARNLAYDLFASIMWIMMTKLKSSKSPDSARSVFAPSNSSAGVPIRWMFPFSWSLFL